MDSTELKRLFERVRNGEIEPEAAAGLIRTSAVRETGGFATLDLNRKLRCGFSEVVFGQGKTTEQTVGILRALREEGHPALVTRITPETGKALSSEFPNGEYNPMARTFRVLPSGAVEPKLGRVVVVTAGTSDLPVAEEARVTAEAWNCEVSLIADVGVAGIHRLFRRLPDMEGADAIVAVAGMEAALPSVLGGLVDCPVIAVPTSVGYGAHFNGLASLLGVLNSCASNVVAVNIDSGFNAGHVAGMIARRMAAARRAGESSK